MYYVNMASSSELTKRLSSLNRLKLTEYATKCKKIIAMPCSMGRLVILKFEYIYSKCKHADLNNLVALRILYVKSIDMITHTCQSAQMKIGACFFATIPLEDRQTVTADGHVQHCLPNFGASAAKKRDSAAFFFFFFMLKKPVCTQQQQRSTFSLRARCRCCRTHIRQTSLPLCHFFLFPEVKKQLKGILSENAEDECRAFTRGLRQTWTHMYEEQ